ncbi:GNAT domain-containing protein [Russula earlei]|uniref:GNAT domain-containing protein n=1 Tax=Russula earlei TaxID=71964 RepID=A0ACC0U7Z4_9AGAM|nr:GNAT domain-containing protein [Russula earlei]
MQFTPLSIDKHTRRPYLRLSAPHQRIIIAAPSLQDAPQICELLNDPRVYRWLLSPPFPYLLEHAVSWLTEVKAEADAVWGELEQANAESPDGPLKVVGGCPVRSILEENEDGTYTYLGDCGIFRNRYEDVMDMEERARRVQENNAKPVGDPDIVWSIGDYLKPSHHGKGIMTAVVGRLMREWGIPRMNFHCVRAATMNGNTGSVRVFEKNGFVLRRECVDVVTKGEPSSHRFLDWILLSHGRSPHRLA